MIYVNRAELAQMMGISERRAEVLLCPTMTERRRLTKEIIDFTALHGGKIPHKLEEPGKPGKRGLLYPVTDYFPLCRWPDVKKLADTRPDVVGEYVAWVMGEYGIKKISLFEVWNSGNYADVVDWVGSLPPGFGG